MRARLSRLARDPRWQDASDILVALVLAGTSVAAVLSGQTDWGTSERAALFLALASTAPVAWRSRYPLSCAGVVLLANAGCVYAASPQQAAFQPFVALVLVAYSAGSRGEGRRAVWASAALAVAAIPLFVAAVVHGADPGNAVPSYVWLLAAWSVGRVVRGWRSKSVALEEANRELAAQRDLQAQAAVIVERGRIARELHDVVAHNVSMMVVQAGAAAQVLTDDQPEARAALEVIADTGRRTVDEMRVLLGVLRQEGTAETLRPQPGLADLPRLVDGVSEAGLPVSLRVEGDPYAVPQALDLSAYRIVQEALTNALKHAGPAQAAVTVRYDPGFIDLRIDDTGTGRRAATGSGGHGLVGMQERALMLGAQLYAAPRDEGGFSVRTRLPVALTSTP